MPKEVGIVLCTRLRHPTKYRIEVTWCFVVQSQDWEVTGDQKGNGEAILAHSREPGEVESRLPSV